MRKKYYRLINDYKGHHYFKVGEPDEPVLKITFGTQPKAGRPWCPGITLIKYITFVSSYGWNLDGKVKGGGYGLRRITKKEFDQAYQTLLKTIGHE